MTSWRLPAIRPETDDMHLIMIPPSGPLDDAVPAAGPLAEVVDATQRMYQQRGLHSPWAGYVAVEQGESVGTCGFAGPPRHGEVEIAYFCFPEHQGRGVATRMASLLIDTHRAAAEAERCVFIAHTLPETGASTRILGKLGFTCLGEVLHPEDGRIWKWRLGAHGG